MRHEQWNNGTASSHPAWDGLFNPSDKPRTNENEGDHNDKTGLTYTALLVEEICNPWVILNRLFPDVAAVSMCRPSPRLCPLPMLALPTAQFLTETHIRTTSPSFRELGSFASATPTDSLQKKSSETSVSFATQSWSSRSDSPVPNPAAPLLSSSVDFSRASQPQPILPTSTSRSSPPQSGISPSSLPPLSQDVASPWTHAFPLPAPLPTAAPPPSTPLSSSAAWISSLTQPTQALTAGSTNVDINVVNIATKASGTTSAVPAVPALPLSSQTRPFRFGISVAITTSRSSTNLVVGTTTLPLPSLSVVASPPPIVIGSNTVIANSASQYIISGTTLLPGSTITIGTGTLATVIALQTSNSETQIIIGTSTSLLVKPSTTEASIGLPAFTIGTQTITANSLSQYIIDSQTLVPGSPLTLGTGPSTTIVALRTSNSQTQLIIGTSTSIIVPQATPPLTSIMLPGAITIGTQTVTPDSVSQYLIASQTLVPGGPAITVSGTAVSLAPGATAVVVGTSTSGLGGYIWSGIGGGYSTTTSGPAVFTGGAQAMVCGRAWGLGLGVFCGVVAIL